MVAFHTFFLSFNLMVNLGKYNIFSSRICSIGGCLISFSMHISGVVRVYGELVAL